VTNRRLSTGRVASRCQLSATETERRSGFLYAIVLPHEPSSETVFFNQRHSRDSAVDSRVGFWGLTRQVRLPRCRYTVAVGRLLVLSDSSKPHQKRREKEQQRNLILVLTAKVPQMVRQCAPQIHVPILTHDSVIATKQSVRRSGCRGSRLFICGPWGTRGAWGARTITVRLVKLRHEVSRRMVVVVCRFNVQHPALRH